MPQKRRLGHILRAAPFLPETSPQLWHWRTPHDHRCRVPRYRALGLILAQPARKAHPAEKRHFRGEPAGPSSWLEEREWAEADQRCES